MPAMKHQQGITLIEVLVSMIIFAVGILGMSTLQTKVLQDNIDQRQRDVAIWKAQAVIDRISLNKTPAALNQYVTSVSNNAVCGATPAKICAETNGGGAAICSATELAAYDAWDILCTNDQGAAALLTDFNANLTCSPTPCTINSDLNLQFLWRALAARSDPRLATAAIDDDADIDDGPDIDGYIQVFKP
jgi:type IV pilus assembly protein PilV